jgi:adhesin transport system membrane fusion protein
MLNVSENRIEGKVNTSLYKSFSMVSEFRARKVFTNLLLISFVVFLIALFLPWTQNIRSKGYVTTLQPDQRPQTINSVIAGKMEKWFVREGDYVKKGDTILFLSEIKDEYFDPNLLERTEQQIKSKELSVQSYMNKIKSLDGQIDALLKTKSLKIEQAKNYIQQGKLSVQSDSVDLEAARTNYQIAQKQFGRQEQLYQEGLKSLTDLETRKLKLQATQAKMISAENKLLTSRNKLINSGVEINSVNNQYRDKLSKAESEKYTALSSMYDAEAVVTKMQNQYMNYSIRTGMYYITSPINGYITKALRSGIGETVKAGEEMMSIMPAKYDLAVEMYVSPFNLPLVEKGQHVRFMFDGWPSVVFSGWPNASFGTFGGEIVAIDNFISTNGKYRILVAPDKKDVEWPKQLRVGSGANGMALLKNVPIWYELWRNLNGFPPDYYKTNDLNKKPETKK